MKIIVIILGYLKWHYGKALISLTRVWSNFLFFVTVFFSLKLLFQNFFDPWKRMSDRYPHNFNLKEYFYAALTNLIVRLFGMIMRFILIIIGLACYILMFLLYPLAMLGWIILPFIILTLLFGGLYIIIMP